VQHCRRGGTACWFFSVKKFQFVEAGAAYRKWLFLADSKRDYLPRLFLWWLFVVGLFFFSFLDVSNKVSSLRFRAISHINWFLSMLCLAI